MTPGLLNIITWIWLGMAVFTFFLLLKIIAPFGRHTHTGFGPMMNNISAWVIMEAVSLTCFSLFFLLGTGEKSVISYFLFGCWVLHYTNRSFIYPLRQKDRSKKMPVAIMGSAIFFNLINGFINGYYLGNYSGTIPIDRIYEPAFIAGFILFFGGMFINMRSDNLLLKLRKKGGTGYKIPKGWLFNLVSCPNHLGEIIEWAGFALMAWNLPALSFAVWTFANLAPRSLAHHKWYLKQFLDYPRKRKAVIPFIF